MTDARYLIGIDLGTTNCVMSSTALNEEDARASIDIEAIAQITDSAVQSESASLPSFVYRALDQERESGCTRMPWQDANAALCAGKYARERAGEVPDRVVASAKSWLCHSGIDRRSALLPVGGEPSERVSPVDATVALLEHLRQAWDVEHPDAPFQKQQIFLTVPASFDPSARQLVEEAAFLADYPDVALLEEPQAAFYAWLHAHADTWRDQLSVGDKVLVVDIGGGTTDFSLIQVQEHEGQLSLERIAVGTHLLLGGDNLDLALAYLAKGKLEEQGHSVDDWQMQSLVHRCRTAKEQFLGENPPETLDITIAGRGSSLIASTLSTTLTRSEVEALLVDGFFPLVGTEERSSSEKRLGMQQVGLPYAQDARVSCQLAKFLSMTGESDAGGMENFVMPTALLFNGGTMRAPALRRRIEEQINSWAGTLGAAPVTILDGADYDAAVSRGATYSGLARRGDAMRIRAGTSRSYFIGVEDAVPAVPGMPPPLKAVCVVPFGMEEGSEARLDQEFALVLGQLATFRFFSHGTATLSDGTEPAMGSVVSRWQHELTELHPIETQLDRGSDDGSTVRVTLHSNVSDVGTLELWCQAQDGRRWKLEFDLRHHDPKSAGATASGG